MSFAYLNNQNEINDQIEKLNKNIYNLQSRINKYSINNHDVLKIKKETPLTNSVS